MQIEIRIDSLINLLNTKNYFTEKGLARFTKLLERERDSNLVSIPQLEAALVMYFVTIKVQEAKGNYPRFYYKVL